MTPEQFTATLDTLGWKQTDFCRKTGLTKQTPSRWVHGMSPIPAWVDAYLEAMLDLAMLHRKYLAPTPHERPTAAPADATLASAPPSRLAHLLPPAPQPE